MIDSDFGARTLPATWAALVENPRIEPNRAKWKTTHARRRSDCGLLALLLAGGGFIANESRGDCGEFVREPLLSRVDTPPPSPGATARPLLAPAAVPALPAATYHDPTTALLLTLGPTLTLAAVGIASSTAETLLVTGAVITIIPSFGHIYAGEAGKAGKMVLLRLAGAALATLMFVDMMRNHESAGQGTFAGGRAVVAVVGFSVIPATLIYEAFDAPRAARRFNEKHGLGLGPVVSPSGPAPHAGLAIQGRF